MGGFWDNFSTLLLITTTWQRIIPEELSNHINRFLQKLVNSINPYIEITFHELPSESHMRSDAYAAIETYLGANLSQQAERLNANTASGSRSVALSIDDYEEITDVYNGVKVWWTRSKSFPKSNVISFYGRDEERRAYVLTCRRRHRDIVVGSYLSHVLIEGKAIAKRNRRQRLYTNISRDNNGWGDDEKMMWRHVAFDHPATFDTLAMDPEKKKDIVDDLVAFTKGKEYYREIGKAWKRGYLLYGPPGTGKSTMIAAMANFLHYDVYDLELTAVKDNTELRKLMIEISKRAIVVIEDIDCSLDITGKRRASTTDEKDNDHEKDVKDIIANKATDNERGNDEESKITLSGLLNFIDGLWSASGGERIIVFTTNYVERLDPALIRRGRMDKHIEMSYCCFEAFKVLAKNYLKLESHEKFENIKCLLKEIDISPADVAENLMPKSPEMSAEECLGNLITALHHAKEESVSRKAKKLEAETEDKESEVKQQSGTSKENVNAGFRKMMLRILAEKYNCFR
ncbi:UNVERIFIED_CONTAM: AAA-ATPase [Sesamum latifolium]|uniref:AAA-ATPase n=1 Tax=Sesamum latifolium TaxID=2727402 RepID=A0AAW2XXC9_9LAMI